MDRSVRYWLLGAAVVLTVGAVLLSFTLPVRVPVEPPSSESPGLESPGLESPSSEFPGLESQNVESLAGPVCFWSTGGPVCVPRGDVGLEGANVAATAGDLMAALVAGPTEEERSEGLFSAIPQGTKLIDVAEDGGTVTVHLKLPAEALDELNGMAVEVIEEQVASTLRPLDWQELHVLALDPATGDYRPLSDFLPELPDPRKATLLSGEEAATAPGAESALPPGQATGYGQVQPQGALSGKTVYVSAGHGWYWVSDYPGYSGSYWDVQRIPYPRPSTGYSGPIIEDHNNAEAVNQYLIPYLWNAGAQVWPVRERDMNDVERIADCDGGGPEAGCSEIGPWNAAGEAGKGYAGTDYRWVETVSSGPTATATWTATLPEDGQYAVYVWYRPGSDRAPDAHYVVHHAGGDTAVIVDQQHHGNTWRYIGAYGFLGGSLASVSLTNESAYDGRVVVADAVRIGGGVCDDLSGVDTRATYAPDKPWWEVAAMYQAQRMGLNPASFPYFNDVVARPMYARWEHAGTGEDAVYISWHTNGGGGQGTMSIIHNGATKPVTQGSGELRDAIHDEVIHDIRTAWDPDWGASRRNMNLGDHDRASDTDALKEPSFNRLAARAVVQGLVKYFEQRDGVDLTLLPEPVRVSWRAPEIDSSGVAGDPATGYRVYTSRDGVGWSDGVAVTGATEYALTGLAAGQIVFVRVASTNAGGESFPTETLAARVGEPAGVLVVSGFDQLNHYLLVPQLYERLGEVNMRMWLDQMNSRDYVIQHGAAIEYPFDSASNEAVTDGLLSLSDYSVVDWILGEQWESYQTLSAVERSALRGYLDGGGALFLSGAELGWTLVDKGVDPSFYTGYVRANYVADNANTYAAVPTAGGIFDGLPSFRFDAPGEYDPDYPDVISTINGSDAALLYQGGAGGTAGVQWANGCERVLHLGFPFETIWPEARPAVMGRVMAFLGECLEVAPESTILSPMDEAAYTETPVFQGTAMAKEGVDHVEVSVRRDSDGAYWDVASWGAVAWQQASGTVSWSFPLPEGLGVGTYTAEARAWNTAGQMDPTPAQVYFALVAPAAYVPVVIEGSSSSVPAPCEDLIVGGDFEQEHPAWELINDATYSTAQVHGGTRSIDVGGMTLGTYSSVHQALTLPAAATITVRYWEYPIYLGAGAGDLQYVWVWDESGVRHTLYSARDNTAGWVERQLDISAFAGQAVTLWFSVHNDSNAADMAEMYVDDVQVLVCKQ